MNKIINMIITLIIIIVFTLTWRAVEMNNIYLNRTYIYIYLIFIAGSLLSDRYFYSGQKSQDKKKYEITSHFIALTWFILLIAPMLEYAYMVRNNLIITVLGAVLVVSGITIRGIGIKTLGKFFSRDVETWDNQKIVKSGIYKYIRHPAYTGNILQTIGFPLILNSYFSLILSFITICGFLWRISVEEKFLMQEIPEYKEYIKKTKRVIPKVW